MQGTSLPLCVWGHCLAFLAEPTSSKVAHYWSQINRYSAHQPQVPCSYSLFWKVPGEDKGQCSQGQEANYTQSKHNQAHCIFRVKEVTVSIFPGAPLAEPSKNCCFYCWMRLWTPTGNWHKTSHVMLPEPSYPTQVSQFQSPNSVYFTFGLLSLFRP
jgi:hypothetical protein